MCWVSKKNRNLFSLLEDSLDGQLGKIKGKAEYSRKPINVVTLASKFGAGGAGTIV